MRHSFFPSILFYTWKYYEWLIGPPCFIIFTFMTSHEENTFKFKFWDKSQFLIIWCIIFYFTIKSYVIVLQLILFYLIWYFIIIYCSIFVLLFYIAILIFEIVFTFRILYFALSIILFFSRHISQKFHQKWIMTGYHDTLILFLDTSCIGNQL